MLFTLGSTLKKLALLASAKAARYMFLDRPEMDDFERKKNYGYKEKISTFLENIGKSF